MVEEEVAPGRYLGRKMRTKAGMDVVMRVEVISKSGTKRKAWKRKVES